jgi:hypothetical protein
MHGGPVGSGTAIIRPSSQGTLVDSINAFDDIRLPALHFSDRSRLWDSPRKTLKPKQSRL